jgi:hypothetical protein
LGLKVWSGFIWIEIGLMAGACEHGNEPSGSVKGEDFLHYLSDCYLLKIGSSSWS